MEVRGIRDNDAAPFLLLSVVIATLPLATVQQISSEF